MKTEIEDYYDILENEDKELLVAMRARAGSPRDSVLLYAGGDSARLRRNPAVDEEILLVGLHPGVRGALKASQEILIAEFMDTSIIREYSAEVKASGAGARAKPAPARAKAPAARPARKAERGR
ncbi:hypothetical protein FACS1894186_5470 [Alphaproteobacteria bacterium]|nr:hypothetical protein FACS1894186_5470 [Alphaproteobacteria bacterium]